MKIEWESDKSEKYRKSQSNPLKHPMSPPCRACRSSCFRTKRRTRSSRSCKACKGRRWTEAPKSSNSLETGDSTSKMGFVMICITISIEYCQTISIDMILMADLSTVNYKYKLYSYKSIGRQRMVRRERRVAHV